MRGFQKQTSHVFVRYKKAVHTAFSVLHKIFDYDRDERSQRHRDHKDHFRSVRFFQLERSDEKCSDDDHKHQSHVLHRAFNEGPEAIEQREEQSRHRDRQSEVIHAFSAFLALSVLLADVVVRKPYESAENVKRGYDRREDRVYLAREHKTDDRGQDSERDEVAERVYLYAERFFVRSAVFFGRGYRPVYHIETSADDEAHERGEHPAVHGERRSEDRANQTAVRRDHRIIIISYHFTIPTSFIQR